MSHSNQHATHRDFYDDYITTDVDPAPLPFAATQSSSPDALIEELLDPNDNRVTFLEYIHDQTIGNYDLITTPFGDRKLTYADFTASGRSLQFIEDYLQKEVLPLYANTHTNADTTGLQTSLFRHEARDIIRRSCRASAINDTVLFTGSGTTAAIHTAIDLLQVRKLAEFSTGHGLPLPVVLVGPMEHHSNLLAWKETGAIVVVIMSKVSDVTRIMNHEDVVEQCQTFGASTQSGVLLTASQLFDPSERMQIARDVNYPLPVMAVADNSEPIYLIDDSSQDGGILSQSHLTHVLNYLTNVYKPPLVVASFSACSNITGHYEDSLAVTHTVKSYPATISMWDYAGCASTCEIDMNPRNLPEYKKDIIVFSPHKIIGGVGTPGVLIIKNYLLVQRPVPHQVGGGTVFFVNPESHVYLGNFHEKEEAGTQDIVGSIRCGMVFQMKEHLRGLPSMRMKALSRFAVSALSQHPLLQLLGFDPTLDRDMHAALVSPAGSSPSIHHSGTLSMVVYSAALQAVLPSQFVSAVLNDLFGIQSRSGCMCAGPFAHALLGITSSQSSCLLTSLYKKDEFRRPGVLRISLHWSMPLYVVEYIVKAVLWCATHAWKLLPLYQCVLSSGEFKHTKRRKREDHRRWLGNIDYSQGMFTYQRKQKHLDDLTGNSQSGSPTQSSMSRMANENLLLSTYLLCANKIVDALPHPIRVADHELGSVTVNDHDLYKQLSLSTDRLLETLLVSNPLCSSFAQHSLHQRLVQPTYLVVASSSQSGAKMFTGIPQLAVQAIQQYHQTISSQDKTLDAVYRSITSDMLAYCYDLLDQTQTLFALLPVSVPPFSESMQSPSSSTASNSSTSTLPASQKLWFPTPDAALNVLHAYHEHRFIQYKKDPQSIRCVQNMDTYLSHINMPSITVEPASIPTEPLSSSLFNTMRRALFLSILTNSIHPGQSSGPSVLSTALPSIANGALSQEANLLIAPFVGYQPGTQTESFSSVYIYRQVQQLYSSSLKGLPPQSAGDSSPYAMRVVKATHFSPKTRSQPTYDNVSTITAVYAMLLGATQSPRLCIHCWHEHKGLETDASQGNAQECTSCECVHFKPFNSVASAPASSTPLPPASTQQSGVASSMSKPNKKLRVQSYIESHKDQPIAVIPGSDAVSHPPLSQSQPALDSTTSSTTMGDDGEGDMVPPSAHPAPPTTVVVTPPEYQQMSKNEQKKHFRHILRAPTSTAMIDFDMVRDGDRVLVAVSGGKDSLTLIHVLLEIQKMVKFKFHIAAATIDPVAPEFDPSPLKDYFKSLGIEYHYRRVNIMAKAKELLAVNPKLSICAFCSRLRRGLLYSICREHNYNVLALGQHLDDFAESFFMSSFYNGVLGTMKPAYTNASGDVKIIRPLCYIREKYTREFAYGHGLPIITENCPACFEQPKERQRVKLMLAQQESIHPMLYHSILKAMMPLMKLGMNLNREQQYQILKDYLLDSTKDDEDDNGNVTSRTTRQPNSNTNVNNKKPKQMRGKNKTVNYHDDKSQPKVVSTSSAAENTALNSPQPVPQSLQSPPPADPASTQDTDITVEVDINDLGDGDSGEEDCKECVFIPRSKRGLPPLSGSLAPQSDGLSANPQTTSDAISPPENSQQEQPPTTPTGYSPPKESVKRQRTDNHMAVFS